MLAALLEVAVEVFESILGETVAGAEVKQDGFGRVVLSLLDRYCQIYYRFIKCSKLQ